MCLQHQLKTIPNTKFFTQRYYLCALQNRNYNIENHKMKTEATKPVKHAHRILNMTFSTSEYFRINFLYEIFL